MAGLRRICKLHGRMRINGQLWLWDYVADQPVLEQDMRPGSERWKASERRKAELMRGADNGAGAT
jgi:hypothetical protein